MVEIREVLTKKQLNDFAWYPQKLYEDCSQYVPMFISDEKSINDTKKNFSLDNCEVKCFLAYRDGKIVGRIAGILQKKYNEIQNKSCIRFSRFDCIDDQEVATALFDAVAAFGREKGMTQMHGPWGFNDQDREGMQTFGFEWRSTYATNYNYEYYEKLVKGYGMQDECEWVEYLFTNLQNVDPRFGRIADKLMKRNGFKEISGTMPVKQIVKQYGKQVFDVINACYSHLDGYVPVEGKILDNVLGQFGTILNPDYLSIITNAEGKVIAMGCALPSICEALKKGKGKMNLCSIFRILSAVKSPKELELGLIAVLPEYRAQGVNALVINRIYQNIIKNGVKHVESNPELVTNHAVQNQWSGLEREIIKRRKCFIVNI